MMKLSLDRQRVRYAVVALILAAMAVGGMYLFYEVAIGRLFEVRNAAMWVTFGFGMVAGMLSFFAPCSLALFPGYMSYYATSDGTSSSIRDSLYLGAVASVGMALAYTIIAFSLSGVSFLLPLRTIMTYTIPVLAFAVLGLGVVFAMGKTAGGRFFSSVSQRIVQRAEERESTRATVFGFGFAYAIGSITCILPIFIVFIVAPFLTGNALTGLAAFGSFIVGKSALMLVATVLTGRSKEHLLTQAGKQFQLVRKLGGALMIFAGLYLMRYAVLLWDIQQPLVRRLFLIPM
ncbi:MAG: cytochrome c biogenesis protein CcdA [Candidatus Nanohaloarchaea archaeon]|nr:cytochrome c biogenesis protein CcdA [Candidatus Nanohaloarchaea archaeon]